MVAFLEEVTRGAGAARSAQYPVAAGVGGPYSRARGGGIDFFHCGRYG